MCEICDQFDATTQCFVCQANTCIYCDHSLTFDHAICKNCVVAQKSFFESLSAAA